jgi:hypothetical protein
MASLDLAVARHHHAVSVDREADRQQGQDDTHHAPQIARIVIDDHA